MSKQKHDKEITNYKPTYIHTYIHTYICVSACPGFYT